MGPKGGREWPGWRRFGRWNPVGGPPLIASYHRAFAHLEGFCPYCIKNCPIFLGTWDAARNLTEVSNTSQKIRQIRRPLIFVHLRSFGGCFLPECSWFWFVNALEQHSISRPTYPCETVHLHAQPYIDLKQAKGLSPYLNKRIRTWYYQRI